VSAHGRGLTKARKTRLSPLSVRAGEILASLAEREDGFVFGELGGPRRAFKRAARVAGIERAWMHLARHLGSTAIGRSGAGVADLMRFGGCRA